LRKKHKIIDTATKKREFQIITGTRGKHKIHCLSFSHHPKKIEANGIFVFLINSLINVFSSCAMMGRTRGVIFAGIFRACTEEGIQMLMGEALETRIREEMRKDLTGEDWMDAVTKATSGPRIETPVPTDEGSLSTSAAAVTKATSGPKIETQVPTDEGSLSTSAAAGSAVCIDLTLSDDDEKKEERPKRSKRAKKEKSQEKAKEAKRKHHA
jgi:hypothetical protein